MPSAYPKLTRTSLRRELQILSCLTTKPFVGEASDLPVARPCLAWRRMVNGHRLTILFWLYVAQALAGSLVGFAAPFLYYFGVL